MHDVSSSTTTTPGALPRRYDVFLGIGAAVSYLGIVAFAITQVFPACRLDPDLRFAIVLWLLAVGGPAALCWTLRPHIAHIAYAMEIGRHLKNAQEYGTMGPDFTRQLAARRVFWGTCGTLAACCWSIAAGIDLGAGVGMLDLRGSNLDLVTTLICQLGAVACVVRIVGPALAELDDVYRLARSHATGARVYRFPTGA